MCATTSSWQSPISLCSLRSSGMISMVVVDFGVVMVMEKKGLLEMLHPRRRGSAFRPSLLLWLQILVVRLQRISIRRLEYDLFFC